MRKDLSKLLCENPRHGSRWKGYREVRARSYDVSEDAPTRESMKKVYGWNTKDQSEYFAPLVGFLNSRVGRKWDDVYSELRANMRVTKAIDYHIMQHLWGFVEKDTFMKDGRVYVHGRYSKPYEIVGYSWYRQLYIHPETGILCRTQPKKKPRWNRKKDEAPRVVIDDNTQLIQKDGLWYVCEMATPEKTKVISWTDWKAGISHNKVVPGDGYDSLFKRWIQYPARYVRKHRSASSKEIKRYVKNEGQ